MSGDARDIDDEEDDFWCEECDCYLCPHGLCLSCEGCEVCDPESEDEP